MPAMTPMTLSVEGSLNGGLEMAGTTNIKFFGVPSGHLQIGLTQCEEYPRRPRFEKGELPGLKRHHEFHTLDDGCIMLCLQ